VNRTPDGFYNGTLYAEYGLTEKLTLGLVANADLDPFGVVKGDGTLFLRFPLNQPDTRSKWAMHFGVGARYEDLEFTPAGEIALGWGRGIQWGARYGWLAVDGRYNFAGSGTEPFIKLDWTFGMGLGETTKAMGQVFMTEQDAVFTSKFAPSLLYTPKNRPFTIQAGAEIPINFEGETALKLGLWMEF
jgi:hypothetical protein